MIFIQFFFSNLLGFTKPRVLIIVPTRNSCLLVIEQLIKLMPELTEKKKVINNKQKCYEEFFEATELSEHDVRKPSIFFSIFFYFFSPHSLFYV